MFTLSFELLLHKNHDSVWFETDITSLLCTFDGFLIKTLSFHPLKSILGQLFHYKTQIRRSQYTNPESRVQSKYNGNHFTLNNYVNCLGNRKKYCRCILKRAGSFMPLRNVKQKSIFSVVLHSPLLAIL